jgi:hypothetical protein
MAPVDDPVDPSAHLAHWRQQESAEEQLLDPRSQKAHPHEQREPAPRAAEESLKTVLILLKKDGKVPRQRAFWVDRQGIDRCGE